MSRKLLVIGLDAADLDVMNPLIARGDLPNIAGLMERGASGVLRSTIPPVSAPAWASFLTGTNPGRHGLYSFVVEREGERGTQLANIGDIHGPKVWDAIAAQGVRPVVANIPVTWPPPAFDGVLVTGMLTPESRDVTFTHPPELSASIREAIPDYRIDIDRDMLDDKQSLFDAMSAMTKMRHDLFLHLMRTEEWGVMIAVFTNTDRVQHSFWRHGRENVEALFKQVDEHVGELIAEVDLEETTVMLMSDHGFQSAQFKLYVNRYLADRGLLATKRSADPDEYDQRRPDYFDDFQGGGGKSGEVSAIGRALAKVGVGGRIVMDWSRTRAFLWSLDTGGIGVNLKSRYAHGTVDDDDYESVRDEIIAALTELRLPDGTPAFLSVRRREEVYDGPFVHSAPDVVVEWSDTMDLGMKLDASEAIRRHKRAEGHHSPRGFVSLTGPGCKAGGTIEGDIIDCLPTILHAAGLSVPEGLDGRVIEEAFDDGRPVTMTDALAATDDTGAAFSAEEEEALRRSLEGLGYL